jgi:hypothetical protein
MSNKQPSLARLDLISSLPQPTKPNQQVHADLFSNLKTFEGGKKFVLCITDAFTKYVQLVTFPNKEAATVATTIFEHSICRFGVPLNLVTDQGKEICMRLSDDFFQWLGLAHLKMPAIHPQCNSQAKVANKTITKCLAAFVDASTINRGLGGLPLPTFVQLQHQLTLVNPQHTLHPHLWNGGQATLIPRAGTLETVLWRFTHQLFDPAIAPSQKLFPVQI